MDHPVKRTNLLTLRGVFPKDFAPVNNIYNSFVEVEKVKSEPTIVYTEMPKKFTGVDTWIKFSNLKCWECDQLPTSYPKFIPLYPEKDKNGDDICDVHGHFCEWNCAVSYTKHKFSEEKRPDILESISLFESKFTGVRRAIIMPSPEKTEMKAYCGKNGITPKQWQDKLAQINADYALSAYQLHNYVVL